MIFYAGWVSSAMRTISGKTDDELDKMEGGQPYAAGFNFWVGNLGYKREIY